MQAIEDLAVDIDAAAQRFRANDEIEDLDVDQIHRIMREISHLLGFVTSIDWLHERHTQFEERN